MLSEFGVILSLDLPALAMGQVTSRSQGPHSLVPEQNPTKATS